MEKVFKMPPFAVDRSLRVGLATPVADALRNAILTGYYAPGEVLPPIRELAAITGVAQVLVVRAIRMLREERLVSPRPHVGCMVCAKNRPLWKGQVLIVVPAGIGNPSDNAIYAVLRDALTSNGYLPLSVTVPRFPDGTFDFALLGAMMRQQTDLVVQLHDKDDIAKYLSRCKMPFIRFSTGDISPKNCVGIIHRRDDLALGDFVRHCVERGVRSVLQVTAMTSGPDVVPPLREVGINAENWCIPPPDGGHDAMGLVQAATDVFAARLAGKGRSGLPDLIFFRDDHLAVGALLALMAGGIRIPEDVSVVTWANTGLGPAFVKPLTRMEQDNSAIGERVAECVLEYLRTGIFPECAAVGPKYVRGESF